MAIEGILFDKDGTLLDFHATWMPIYRQASLHAAKGDAMLASALLEHSSYDKNAE